MCFPFPPVSGFQGRVPAAVTRCTCNSSAISLSAEILRFSIHSLLNPPPWKLASRPWDLCSLCDPMVTDYLFFCSPGSQCAPVDCCLTRPAPAAFSILLLSPPVSTNPPSPARSGLHCLSSRPGSFPPHSSGSSSLWPNSLARRLKINQCFSPSEYCVLG